MANSKMSTSLEDRLATVEKELAALKRLVRSQTEDSWESTFGLFSDDAGFDEVLRAGAEIRARERNEGEDMPEGTQR